MRRHATEVATLDQEMQEKMQRLSTDFAAVWNDSRTADRERKRMVRLLLEDVTVRKESPTITLYIRFKGGKAKTIDVACPLTYCERTRVGKEVVEEIDRLLDCHTNREIAEMLNDKGLLSGQGKTFDGMRVNKVRRAYGLKSRYTRLRDRGCLTTRELTQRYGVCRGTVRHWRLRGILVGHMADDQGEYLFEDPGPAFEHRGRRLLPQYQSSTNAKRGAV